MACIVIDVGNSSTSIGRYEAGRVERVSAVHGGIEDPRLVDRALQRAGAGRAERAVLASVVPSATPRWRWLLRRIFRLETFVLTHRARLPVGIRYPAPERIGADRLANACAAVVRYGAPAVVADFGTALTFDVIDARGDYIGGVIAPGLPLMRDYLHEKTALLPRLRLGDGTAVEPVGSSTEAAMRIGALVGHRGMVREIVTHLARTTGPTPHLCATGGYARWALDGFEPRFAIDPDLTLFGLGVVHERNEA